MTYLAINLVQRRLRDHHPSDLSPYKIIGAPTDLAGAEALKEISPHQFEWWAVDLAGWRRHRCWMSAIQSQGKRPPVDAGCQRVQIVEAIGRLRAYHARILPDLELACRKH